MTRTKQRHSPNDSTPPSVDKNMVPTSDTAVLHREEFVAPDPQSSPRLEVRRLTKRLEGNTIVDGFDLTIGAGENVVLLGPSGCGKTTTLRMVAGLIRPDSGEIRLNGTLASGPGAMVPTERRHLGMVFQNYAVWPHKSVFDNVAYGLQVARRPKPEIQQRVTLALALVQLDGLAQRFPGDLSGGQQQRVALARAIVTEPSLLLLDEPLSNLDAVLRKEMRIELKQLTRRIGMTSLYVTHDQEEALALADRIVVMNRGRIEQIGTPLEIYRRPRTRFVAAFVGTTNLIDGTVEAQEREPAGGKDGGRLLVATSLGIKVWARAAAETIIGNPPGSSVVLSVRPEGLLLGADANVTRTITTTAGALTSARLDTSVFLGNRHELHLNVNGQIVNAQAATLDAFRDGLAPFSIDDELAWVVP
jgi:iron(III) transport system ATP-binding protein